MIDTSTPFDHRPDAVLGRALRAALSGADDAAFVARVKAAGDAAHPGHWEVLASWAHAGIVAATAALVGGLMIGSAAAPKAQAYDLVASAASPAARRMVVTARPPHPSVLLLWTEEE